MNLWVGLGNPGKQYANTRHNIGEILLRLMFPDASFTMDRRFNSFLAQMDSGLAGDDHQKNILLLPQTFMNLSGEAVVKALHFFKIKPARMVVLHDEVELAPGKVAYKFGGGHRGHNGLRSIMEQISSPDFHRIRIGVGRPEDNRMSLADYVLSKIPQGDIPGPQQIWDLINENYLNASKK